MSRINDHKSIRRAGFTLVEVMVATSLLAVVLTGVLSAYLFIGRNLTRLVNLQEQEVASRGALRRFTEDVSAAISLTTATSTTLAVTQPTASGITTVTYTYTAGNGTVTRADAAGTQKILSNVTAFSISYYNESGTTITSSPQSIKSAELSFSTAVGTVTSGTRATYATVSPRVILRNKPVLQ